MTREEYIAKFRGRFLVFLTEAWACRHSGATALGLLMDRHALDLRALLGETWDALNDPTILPLEKPTNGQNTTDLRRTR